MREAYICAYVRTPIGRYGGALASVRADDLGAVPLRAIMERFPRIDLEDVDDVIFGCANQAGEDNRNVARMSLLLAGLPASVSGTTINRLCGSGMDAVIAGARAIRSGDADLIIAGGVESMSRAPFVMPKADTAFSRNAEIFDTTIGWRFINPLMKQQYCVDSMPETGENVAEEFGVSRQDQDAFALRSQQKAAAAQRNGRFEKEIAAVTIKQRRGRCRRRRHGRASARRHNAGDAGQTFYAVSGGWQRDGRQCVGRQRRRGCADRCIGRGRKEVRARAHRAHSRRRRSRCCAAHHGHRPGARDAESSARVLASSRRISTSSN